jgi:hypothetical protein
LAASAGSHIALEHIDMSATRLAPSLLIGLALLQGCSNTIPNRDPTGEPFPAVVGESLEEERIALPGDLAGEPAILLIGYEQKTQFDIDRWILGLLQAEVDARIVEIPTIPGLAGRLASGWIDDGMRAGIPREEWSAVVTLYGGAAGPVADFTGTTGGQNARVIVLDASGRVHWFDDSGYSARKVLDVRDRIAGLRE